MEIYVMRHGQAKMMAKNDSQRELTRNGITQVKKMAKKLSLQISAFDYTLVSPFVRAQQTMKKVGAIIPELGKIVTLDELTPGGDAGSVKAFLGELEENSRVLIVSHLPLVGYMVEVLVPEAGAPLFATSAVAHIRTDQRNTTLVSLEQPGR
ncbi:MAG: Phosphohistidine phosphatase SixA [Candidatus Celerinatantimonas neptuna]|nr:MAG: Phosphohistidine phosphatase SixA [Candidatus Celerinatantimonas neptuna]